MAAHQRTVRTELQGIIVLLVEDDDDAREVTAFMLRCMSATVLEASSATEALAKLQTERVHVLVSDIAMPDQDGHALVRSLRALPVGSQISAIALSAFDSAEDKRRSTEAGFDLHLPKPVDVEDLTAALVRLARSRGTGEYPRFMAADSANVNAEAEPPGGGRLGTNDGASVAAHAMMHEDSTH